METMKKGNRLGQETSPYLLQHAQNPVDWYPWGSEALTRARREAKPIFLSIGYSACHWCHVMERESFEDEETAKIMNAHFINIKVDREERQDLDHIYMTAVQAMTQRGGWPMSVFLTPDLEPFYGGTYFPPDDRMGMPSFKKVLLGVSNAWTTKREDVVNSAKQLTSALVEINENKTKGQSQPAVSLKLIADAAHAIAGNFDKIHGGFGNAPKFFHTMDLKVLLREWKRSGEATTLGMVTLTLDQIARGGVYDHLGGGFHRYSTDEKWLAPHFEKMLYDNALLAEVYLETYQATKQVDFAHVARQILDYVLREMTSEEGGFFSTQDADTEGVEGKFYVWSHAEIEQLLGKDLAGQFTRVYNVLPEGNWEGHNILHLQKSLDELAADLGTDRQWLEESLAVARRKLFAARAERVAPFRDEKVLVSWNGLMIHAMAMGYQVLGDERYLAAAQAAAIFVLEKMGAGLDGKGPMQHAHKDGRSRFTAYLDDYASLCHALVTLYESDFDSRWVTAADGLASTMIARFWDDKAHGFYFTAVDHEKLISRPKDIHDGATPSGTSMAVSALVRMGKLTQRAEYLKKAELTLQASSEMMRTIPTATGQLLVALDMLMDHPQEIVVAPGESAEEVESVLRILRNHFLPNRVLLLAKRGVDSSKLLQPLLTEKVPVKGQTTVYICENFSCQSPLVGTENIEKTLAALSRQDQEPKHYA